MKRNFDPWIGEKYRSADNYFGCKMLVVGLSFYGSLCVSKCKYDQDCGREDCKNWAKENIESEDIPAYSKFTKMFSNDMTTRELSFL